MPKTSTPIIMINLAALIAMLVVNTMANALRLGGVSLSEIAALFPNLISPASFTFAIWGIIYLGLLGFAIYSVKFWNKSTPKFLDRIGWLFVLSCVANSSSLVFLHYMQFVPAFLSLAVLMVILWLIYKRLDIGHVQVGVWEKWLVHVPFSVYLAWIVTAALSELFVSIYTFYAGQLPPSTQFWASSVMFATTLMGVWALATRRDYAFALTLVWVFYGIYFKRVAETGIEDGFVENISVFSIFGLSIAMVIIRFWRNPSATPRR